MDKKIIYIAGPLYNSGERYYLECIDDICRECEFETYLPHRDSGLAPANGSVTEPFFRGDVEALERADLVVAILNGADVDSGTAWEMGFAYAKGKVILGICDDTRIDEPLAGINLMITSSAKIFKTLNALEIELTKLQREGKWE